MEKHTTNMAFSKKEKSLHIAVYILGYSCFKTWDMWYNSKNIIDPAIPVRIWPHEISVPK